MTDKQRARIHELVDRFIDLYLETMAVSKEVGAHEPLPPEHLMQLAEFIQYAIPSSLSQTKPESH